MAYSRWGDSCWYSYVAKNKDNETVFEAIYKDGTSLTWTIPEADYSNHQDILCSYPCTKEEADELFHYLKDFAEIEGKNVDG